MQNFFTRRGVLLERRGSWQPVTQLALQRRTRMNFLERKIEGATANCVGAVKLQNRCVAFSRFVRVL